MPVLRRQSEVFDVMLHSISSPAAEGRSPPPVRCSSSKPQLSALSCSLTRCLDVLLTVLQLQWHASVDETGELSVACIAPVSLSDGLIRGGHGQYSNGWGHLVIEFSCLLFLGSILHSSFEGAGRAKSNAGLTKTTLEALHGSGWIPLRG
jgi:hypothetical protein